MKEELCEYCHYEYPAIDTEGIYAYVDDESELCIDHDEGSLTETALINYCPMCGRKLGDNL